MVKDFLERLAELVQEDDELHDALVRLLNAQADHEEALARKASMKVNR